MNLTTLLRIFSDHTCRKVYVKQLSPNDNSKNQVYVAKGSAEALNIFPIRQFFPAVDGERKSTTFIGAVDFYWIDADGKLCLAPHAKFIVYPDYPEVRFSGFLLGSKNSPRELMNGREKGRILFLGVSDDRKLYGFVCSAESQLAEELNELKNLEDAGLFKKISLEGRNIILNSKLSLLQELKRIHSMGWIASKRLDKYGNIQSCNAPQCGGYTLEAELGIIPNSNAAPDYLGWEIKQFKVNNFERLGSTIITLMTPEPDGGYYVEHGVKKFLLNYGYPDRKILDRINFGGIYKNESYNTKTKLTLKIQGFDIATGLITDTNGGIFLIDSQDHIAASWSFSSILNHWNRKHAKAGYVPSKLSKEPERKYLFGNKIILGEQTDFVLFLKQLSLKNIYYDPGIKLENASTMGKDKRRSQFRIKSKNLFELYKTSEVFDLRTL